MVNSMNDKNILFIDDDKLICELIDEILTNAGYVSYTAYSGLAGLNLALTFQPKLIILDILMPKLNGWDVLKLLKFDDRTKHIPVIVATASNFPDDRKKAFSLGADSFIQKPFTSKELFDVLNLIKLPETVDEPHLHYHVLASSTQEAMEIVHREWNIDVSRLEVEKLESKVSFSNKISILKVTLRDIAISNEKPDLDAVFEQMDKDIKSIAETGTDITELMGKKDKFIQELKAEIAPPIEVYVTDDKMEAYLSLRYIDRDINREDVLEHLAEAGVVYGIKRKEVERLVKTVNEKKTNIEKFLVAQGKPPKDGKDSTVKLYFTKAAPKLVEDEKGRVDFKSVKIINQATAGQLIAEKLPPEKGEDGITVTGEKISAHKGKDIPIKLNPNIKVSEDGMKFYSKIVGNPYFDGTELGVNELYIVEGDVDYSTGNIIFVGDVRIKGNVLSGFEIRAGGNVTIEGFLEGNVNIGRDLVVKKGIIGTSEHNLKIEGNLYCEYIQNASIEVEGNVEVATGIVNSRIKADRDVKVIGRKPGSIVGGVIQAGTNIVANVIGSPMGVKTVVMASWNAKIKKKINILKTAMNIKKQHLDSLERIYKKYYSGNQKIKKNSDFEKLTKKMEEVGNEIDILEAKIRKMEYVVNKYIGRVEARDILYSGVILYIGDNRFEVKRDLKSVIIRYEGKTGEFKKIWR